MGFHNSQYTAAGDSEKLITASADSSVKLWDIASGKDLFTFKSQEPCRAVAFSLGDRMAAYSTDQFMGQPSAIHLVNIADNLSEQKGDVIKSLSGPKGRITRVAWTDLNRTLVTAGEDGFVRRWDVEVSLNTSYLSTKTAWFWMSGNTMLTSLCTAFNLFCLCRLARLQQRTEYMI